MHPPNPYSREPGSPPPPSQPPHPPNPYTSSLPPSPYMPPASQGPMTQPPIIPWYAQPWFIVLMLFVFAPAGLVLLWVFSKWNRDTKIILTVASILFLGYVTADKGDQPPGDRFSILPLSLAPRRSYCPSSTRPPVTAKPTAVPTKPKKSVSPQQAAQQTIRDLMDQQFGDRLRQVKVSSPRKAGYAVAVEFDLSERLTEKATVNYLKGDMRDAYKNLYSSGVKLRKVTLTAFLKGTDKFGATTRTIGFQTALAHDVAQNIAWSNYEEAHWDDLWTVLDSGSMPPESGADGNNTSPANKERLNMTVRVRRDISALSITNGNSFAYSKGILDLNLEELGSKKGAYDRASMNYHCLLRQLDAGDNIVIPLVWFRNARGQSFDLGQFDLESVRLVCQTPYGYRQWSGEFR